jgi:xanthine dehydrogenase accessory factor
MTLAGTHGLICGGKVSGLILPRAAEAAEVWQQLVTRDQILTSGVRDDFAIQLEMADDSDTGWFYRETVAPPCALWIAGSGHVAQAAAPLALSLDFQVTVFDDTAEPGQSPVFSRKARSFAWGPGNRYWKNLSRTTPTFGLNRHAWPSAGCLGVGALDPAAVRFSRDDRKPPEGAAHL